MRDIPAIPVPGKKRASTFFEEMKQQAAKDRTDEQPKPDVIYRKPSATAQADRGPKNKEAPSDSNRNAGRAAVENAPESASTRGDIPLSLSRSKQEKTKILSPKKEKANRTVDGFTGQVPLPGFDEKPAASDRRQDDVWEKQLREARSKRIQNFVLSGQEEENEPEENLDSMDDDDKVVIDDYESLADAPVIRMDLSSRRRSVGLRLGVTLLAEVVLLALSLHTLWIPDLLGNTLTIPVKLVVNALLTAGVILLNASTFFGGLGRLFHLSADLDTGAAVSLLAALLHNVVMLCVSDAFASSGLYVYNAAAVLAMVCNLWGKFSMITRIERNFELVGNDDPKKAAVLLENSQSAEEIGHGAAFGEPLVCCEKDTVTIRRYLDHSYVQDPADESAQRLSPYILVAGIIGAVLAFFAAPDRSLSLIYAVTALSAVACVCVPVASLLAGNLPLGHACRRLRQQGVLLTGYDAVYDFAYANVLAVNARDLFPKGTIGLHQVKTFGNQSIDRALLDAAGLAIAADGPLASIFDEIIEGQRNDTSGGRHTGIRGKDGHFGLGVR